jgi:predicted nuclease of predicted toxin-antitoxin system
MKFLCDVHISFKLVNALNQLGYECVHVNNILDKWFTKDEAITKFADKNDYIIITKDADFRNSFFINRTPKKLLKVNLGNITNHDLIKIVTECMPKIENVSQNHKNFIIEIDLKSSNYITLD